MDRLNQRSEKIAENIAGTCTDPIIVHPGGWGDTLPGWLKEAIIIDRLKEEIAANREGREPTGTDSEACAYFYTLALVQPLTSEGADIHTYLVTKLMKEHRNVDVPDDVRREELSQYLLGELADLKRWIYERRLKARKSNVTKCPARRIS